MGRTSNPFSVHNSSPGISMKRSHSLMALHPICKCKFILRRLKNKRREDNKYRFPFISCKIRDGLLCDLMILTVP